MSRLFMLLLSISMSTMAGIGVVIVLVLGQDRLWPILAAAAAGAALSLPITWFVARRIAGEAESEIEG